MADPRSLAPLRLPPSLVRAGVELRPEVPDDFPLARMLYAASRADELVRAPWPPAMIETFLDGQFAAQSAHYAAHHPAADRWIVARRDVPIGRLYVDRTGDDWRLLDIVLMPEIRGAGIGAALVAALVRAARQARVGVTLQVAHDNGRAEVLYRRLGFVDASSHGATHRAMRYPAGAMRHPTS